jgi:hypothetical protein
MRGAAGRIGADETAFPPPLRSFRFIRNIRAALGRIIEKAGTVEVTAAAVVSAIHAYAKINANGEWVERVEHVDLRAVFDRMSRQELEIYARENKLPTWVDDFLGGTRVQAIEEGVGG